MKPGDLAYVDVTLKGDSEWVVTLYRTRKPFVIIKVDDNDLFPWVTIWHDGQKKWINEECIRVIKT